MLKRRQKKKKGLKAEKSRINVKVQSNLCSRIRIHLILLRHAITIYTFNCSESSKKILNRKQLLKNETFVRKTAIQYNSFNNNNNNNNDNNNNFIYKAHMSQSFSSHDAVTLSFR